jgi:5-amino-6-(5-phosphoribosylamino)uracil reductase
VNGPIAKQIRLNSGFGLLGPDPRHPAGASIGRAIRLLLQNVGGALPGVGTMAMFGGMRYTAVIVGAGTVRHDGFPMIIRYDDLRARRQKHKGTPHPVNVILTHGLDLPIGARVFSTDDTHRIIFTTREAPAARVKRFSKVAEVVVLPGKSLSPRSIVSQLNRRGMKSLLLEGGGEVHVAFAMAGLVERLYVTLTPRLIGGQGAPSLLDGGGFLRCNHLKLKLESLRRRGDEVFLRYRVLGPTPRR